MFKVVTLLKRKPGISLEEFVAGYESGHAKLGAELLDGHAIHYVRRYLHPLPSTRPAAAREPDYDVVMEIWYEDRAAFDRMRARLSDPEVAAAVAADEARYFDRTMIRAFVVEEHETAMPDVRKLLRPTRTA